MGARVSPEMKEARRLVEEEGLNQYQAAKLSGITRSAISQAAWYKEFMKKKAEQEAKSTQGEPK